ncbi:MAG: glycosyltransferase family 2 protein [Flavobacteriaceae bacterium]|jgi:GT2 family glycosyltransferase|nr:glycosyltransferase family 2 protein [Flavobacteriaceae bacterium]
MKQLSIVVVNYNSKEFLENCIQSCLKAIRNLDAEIIVVDNNSTDGSKEYITTIFPRIIWIQNSKNEGFSKANNQGVESSEGRYVLILNPDTQLPEDIFEKIIPFAESKEDLGALGVRIVDSENRYRSESKRNIPGPKNTFRKLFIELGIRRKREGIKGYYEESLGEFEVGEVEILTGCFFFTRREVYKGVGGFDESYFMYGEDIDLSYTLLKSGYRNYYFGQSTILHYKGGSTVKDKIYYQRFFTAMEIFIKKHYRRPFYTYITLLTGLKIRYYLALCIAWFQKK